MKKIIFRSVSVLLTAVIFYFLGREFFNNWEKISSYTFNFNVPILMMAIVAYVVMVLLFSWGWHLILRYLRHPIPLYETILYFCLTQPAKYIPGKIWLPVARMKFCKRHRVSHSVTLLSTGIESAMEILAGTYVSILAIFQMPSLGKFSILGTILLTFVGLVLLYPRVFYFFINIYLKLAKKDVIPCHKHATFLQLLFMQAVFAAGMFGLGLSQVLFLQSFVAIPASEFAYLISVGVLSTIIGMVAVFAPAGLGVREGVWYVALTGITLPYISLIYVFASRAWMIIVDAVLLFVATVLAALKRPVPPE